MKEYLIICDVKARGTQNYTVQARSPKEALQKFAKGKAVFEGEELEVTDIGSPEVRENT